MSTLSGNPLPGDTPILVCWLMTGHRITPHGPACGTRQRLVRSTANAALAHKVPPCPECWGGARPW